MSNQKPNWKHSCPPNTQCCKLMLVIGKLDIYYIPSIKVFVVRTSDETHSKHKSIADLRQAALQLPDTYPGVVVAIDMGALDRTS